MYFFFSLSVLVFVYLLIYASPERPWPPFSSWGVISHPAGTSHLLTWLLISKFVFRVITIYNVPVFQTAYNLTFLLFGLWSELHCRPNGGRTEALGDAWRGVQRRVWSGSWPTLCSTGQAGMNRYSWIPWQYPSCDEMIERLTCLFLSSFRDLTLVSNCITKSWRQCWNRYLTFFI